MALSNRFNRGGAAPATTAQPRNRYAGIEPTNGSNNDPAAGDYDDLEVVSSGYAVSKKNPQVQYFEAVLRVVKSDPGASPEGSEIRFGQPLTFRGTQLIRDFHMCCHGFDDYDAWNQACAGMTSEETEAIAGKHCAARVTLGAPDGKGGHYLDWQFATVD